MLSSSQLGKVASLAAVNTTLGAAAGALSGMFTSTIIDEGKTGLFQWDTTASMNGCLTGLVAITAACATVEPWAAFVIGIIAGWVYLGASALMLKCKIDDAVDAIPVHLFGGAWGVIAAGLFSNEGRMEAAAYSTENIGWYVIFHRYFHCLILFFLIRVHFCIFFAVVIIRFYEWGRGSGNFTLIGIQLVSILFVIGWVTVVFTPFCLALKYMDLLRIDPLEEEVGMDISRHKGPAYSQDGSVKSEVLMELNQSRRNLFDVSTSGRGSKTFNRIPLITDTNKSPLSNAMDTAN